MRPFFFPPASSIDDRDARTMQPAKAGCSSILTLPHHPFRRAFVTSEPTEPNYFSPDDRGCGELSVAFCSCARRQKKRRQAVLGATASVACELRFMRLIARIQRNKSIFGHFMEKRYGRIDVHIEKRFKAGKSLLQRTFGPSRRLSTEWISCLKSIDT
jgi:hypothetical protein